MVLLSLMQRAGCSGTGSHPSSSSSVGNEPRCCSSGIGSSFKSTASRRSNRIRKPDGYGTGWLAKRAARGEGQMAVLLGRLFSVAPAVSRQLPPLSKVAVRFASKKTGGSSKNLGGKSPGKRYGIKKLEGAFVHAGNIVATQRVMRWHPGAHVGMGRNRWLYALEDGIVRFTKEVYIPPPQSTESKEVICQLPKGAVLYKTFINVVPTAEVGSFKLVNML